jgi:hypothetical protein
MSHKSSDERLVQFLQAHHASPPPPKEDIENALMAQVEAEPSARKIVAFPQVANPRWAFGSLIAASVLLLFGSVRFLPPTPSATQETAELEAFLLENWEAVTTSTPTETTWLILEQPEPSNRR